MAAEPLYLMLNERKKVRVTSFDVRYFGAETRRSDNSGAFQDAVDSGAGEVLVPPGVWSFTAGFTIKNGCRLRGLCSPGAANGNANLATLRHDYDGTFITFDGSLATNRGAGGGLANLIIEQNFGNSGAARGRAVLCTGTTTALRSNWVRIENCQIENASGKDKWLWGIDLDGSTVGGTDGVRDFWVINTRIVGDSTGGAMRVYNAFNVFVSASEFNTTGSDLVISGPNAGGQSSSVFLLGSTFVNVEIDYAAQVFMQGGSLTALTDTANSSSCQLFPALIASAPSSLLGTHQYLETFDDTANRRIRMTTIDSAVTAADLDTTPSVNGVELLVLSNSGATNVTAFDDGYSGQTVSLHFTNANTTLVDGATLQLAGGANFVGSADDVLTIQKRSTVWYEVSRSVN